MIHSIFTIVPLLFEVIIRMPLCIYIDLPSLQHIELGDATFGESMITIIEGIELIDFVFIS